MCLKISTSNCVSVRAIESRAEFLENWLARHPSQQCHGGGLDMALYGTQRNSLPIHREHSEVAQRFYAISHSPMMNHLRVVDMVPYEQSSGETVTFRGIGLQWLGA